MDNGQSSPSTLTRHGQSTLTSALQYAAYGWYVIPIHPQDKRPLIKWGTGASINPAQIHTWFTQWPEANIALKTGVGSSLAVVDIDSPEGWKALQEACKAAGEALPLTRTIRTARGVHLYFRITEPLRSQKLKGLELKADKTYVLAPPSLHPSGVRYSVLHEGPTKYPYLPQFIIQLFQTHAPTREKGPENREPIPQYLSGLPATDRVAQVVKSLSQPPTNAEEIQRIVAEIETIDPDCPREAWFRVGMALKEMQIIGAQGADQGLEIWDAWSSQGEKYPGRHEIEYQWNSFHGRPPGEGVGTGTIFYLSQQYPRKNGDNNGTMNGAPADHILFQNVSADHDSPIVWPDGTHKIKGVIDKRPWPTIPNAVYAIKRMQYECSYDVFKNKMRIAGAGIEAYEGPLSDQAVLAAYARIYERFKLDAGPNRTRAAIEALCTQHRYDPVLDYFNSLQWDTVPRLDDWLATYCGAENTALNRAFGAKVLIATVRRQYQPGTKFDQLLILEGPQGIGKSTLLRALAVRDEWFKDRDVFHLATREQQEALQGVLILEVSELKGLRKAEVASVRQFLSRQEDTARPAYGHYEMTMARRAMMIGTTNETVYLQDDANRRFWPVVTGEINVERFTRERDQIWAEAVARERKGESIALERGYWELARQQQEERQERDVWFRDVEKFLLDKTETSVRDILGGAIMLQTYQMDKRCEMRIAAILRELEWRKLPRTRLDNPTREPRWGR